VHRNITLSVSFLAFAFSVSNTFGLTREYDQVRIKRAGDGCVGGHVSTFGSDCAYYRGNAEQLNRKLKELSEEFAATSRIEIRIYNGTKTIEYGEERPIGTLNPKSRELQIDWSVSKIPMQHEAPEKGYGNLPWPSIIKQAVNGTSHRVPYRLPPSTMIIFSVWKGDRIMQKEIACPPTININTMSK